MRKILVIVVVGVIAAVGGVIGVRSWLVARARHAEVDRKVTAARTLMQSEKGLSQAAVELDAALLLAPDDLAALLARGEVALRLAQLDDALRHLDHALSLAEGSDRIHSQLLRGRALAERYRGANRDDDFRAAHNAFLEARQDPAFEAEALNGYAALFLEKGPHRDVEKALAVFDEFLAKHPESPDAPAVRELVDFLRRKPGSGG